MRYIVNLLLISICFFGCSHTTGFEDYRYNPFQFPYSEYYLKADKTTEINRNTPGIRGRQLSFFGVEACVPETYYDEVNRRGDGSPLVLKRNGEIVLLSVYHQENLMGCNSKAAIEAHKDFCNAFASTEEFHRKLFQLSPDDTKDSGYLSDGDLWIIHRKGMIFNQTERIHIYQLDGLSAFRQDLKETATGKILMHVFPQAIAPDFIEIVLFEEDENVVKEILHSMNKVESGCDDSPEIDN